MNGKPTSSFWGVVSYVGLCNNVGKILVVAGGREYRFRRTDPGVKHLKVTSGSQKFFVVFEETEHGDPYSTHQIIAVLANPSIGTGRALQQLIQDGELTQNHLRDELPLYLLEK